QGGKTRPGETALPQARCLGRSRRRCRHLHCSSPGPRYWRVPEGAEARRAVPDTRHGKNSQVICVLAELPVGDEPLEALDLVALEGEERRHEVLAEHGGELAVGFQRVE